MKNIIFNNDDSSSESSPDEDESLTSQVLNDPSIKQQMVYDLLPSSKYLTLFS